jgi:hypothetical protein
MTTLAVLRDQRNSRRRKAQALITQALRHGVELPDVMPRHFLDLVPGITTADYEDAWLGAVTSDLQHHPRVSGQI